MWQLFRAPNKNALTDFHSECVKYKVEMMTSDCARLERWLVLLRRQILSESVWSASLLDRQVPSDGAAMGQHLRCCPVAGPLHDDSFPAWDCWYDDRVDRGGQVLAPTRGIRLKFVPVRVYPRNPRLQRPYTMLVFSSNETDVGPRWAILNP